MRLYWIPGDSRRLHKRPQNLRVDNVSLDAFFSRPKNFRQPLFLRFSSLSQALLKIVKFLPDLLMSTPVNRSCGFVALLKMNYFRDTTVSTRANVYVWPTTDYSVTSACTRPSASCQAFAKAQQHPNQFEATFAFLLATLYSRYNYIVGRE